MTPADPDSVPQSGPSVIRTHSPYTRRGRDFECRFVQVRRVHTATRPAASRRVDAWLSQEVDGSGDEDCHVRGFPEVFASRWPRLLILRGVQSSAASVKRIRCWEMIGRRFSCTVGPVRRPAYVRPLAYLPMHSCMSLPTAPG